MGKITTSGLISQREALSHCWENVSIELGRESSGRHLSDGFPLGHCFEAVNVDGDC
jgi:hypothetical protein